MKKILLFCCKGFETMEFSPFVDVMGWALTDFGVNVVNEPVVEDDNIITSYCPETAAKVAFRLLGKLAGEDLRDKVMYKMGY